MPGVILGAGSLTLNDSSASPTESSGVDRCDRSHQLASRKWKMGDKADLLRCSDPFPKRGK